MYSTRHYSREGKVANTGPVSSVNHFIEEVRHKLSIQPNLVTYTMADRCGVSVLITGNLREATRLLTVLSDNGLKPDAYHY